MRVIVSLLLFMGVMAVIPAFSQARTVTNADLEKYRHARLEAEKDYNRNYAKYGFPSPEELQKQLDKNKTERDALSARLANERIEQERVAAVLEAAAGNVPTSCHARGDDHKRHNGIQRSVDLPKSLLESTVLSTLPRKSAALLSHSAGHRERYPDIKVTGTKKRLLLKIV